MGGLFQVDGILYKFCTIVYNFIVINILWFIFSLPLFTIGASTTALFYITGKYIIDKEDFILDLSELVKVFWKGFKENFKQATIVWLVLICGFLVSFFNINFMQGIAIQGIESLANFIIAVNIIIFVELIVISIYIFPLLARYHVKVWDGLKMAFLIGNRHVLTTILCLAVIPGILFLTIWKGALVLIVMSIYSCWVSYLIKNKLGNLNLKLSRQKGL